MYRYSSKKCRVVIPYYSESNEHGNVRHTVHAPICPYRRSTRCGDIPMNHKSQLCYHSSMCITNLTRVLGYI